MNCGSIEPLGGSTRVLAQVRHAHRRALDALCNLCTLDAEPARVDGRC